MPKFSEQTDLMIVGSGNLARTTIYALSQLSGKGKVIVLGRNTQQLSELITSANICAHRNNSGYKFDWEKLQDNYENLDKIILSVRPKIILNCLSLQSPWQLSSDSKWSKLVQECGFGSTVIFQLPIALRIANTIKENNLSVFYINACYPDVVNPIISQLNLSVNCGIGNVAILDELTRYALNLDENEDLVVIGHHYHVNQLIKPPEQRTNFPIIYLNNKEITDVAVIFGKINLPTSSLINQVTGNNSAHLINSLINYVSIKRNLPGVNGHSGGLPVEISDFCCKIVLPEFINLNVVEKNNLELEKAEGIVSREGILVLHEKIHEYLKQIDKAISKPLALDELAAYLLQNDNVTKLINRAN